MREESWKGTESKKNNKVGLLKEGSDFEKMIELTLTVEIVNAFIPRLCGEKCIGKHEWAAKYCSESHNRWFPSSTDHCTENRFYFDDRTFQIC